MAILIFDFDGTIHDSMCIYAPAVRACQKEYAAKGLLPDREVPDAEIRSYLGMTARDMWKAFAPHLPKEQCEEGSQFIYREMERLARSGEARLYDGAVSVLQELKSQGHRLVFLSNCSQAYMDLHRDVFGLDQIFHEMYCAGQFGWEAKPSIVRQLISGGNWKEPLIISIGDRYYDMEITQAKTPEKDIKTIFCAYGFGTPEEGQAADAVAETVERIPAGVRQVMYGDTRA